MRLTLTLPVLAAAALAAACAPAASPSAAASSIQLTCTPTATAVAKGPITVALSAPVPATPGKRYRLALATVGAKDFDGPSHFATAGATKDTMTPVSPATWEIRLLESDGPECPDGKPGPCARNEHAIATCGPITVGPKAD